MKKTAFNDYERFLVIAHKTKNLPPNYTVYLQYKEVLEFVSGIAGSNSDVFSYKGNIYNKKITSGQAMHILNSHNNCKFDSNLIICANQIGVQLGG
tara:strand:+ start:51 stop:338 length:288 start_codon:yes stop_codon:yes gene_type:complete